MKKAILLLIFMILPSVYAESVEPFKNKWNIKEWEDEINCKPKNGCEIIDAVPCGEKHFCMVDRAALIKFLNSQGYQWSYKYNHFL